MGLQARSRWMRPLHNGEKTKTEKLYQSNAEKQKAYRLRKNKQEIGKMADLSELRVGDRVAITSWWNNDISEDIVEKLTPKQGVLVSGKKFKLISGAVLGDSNSKTVVVITDEISLQLQQQKEKDLEVRRLSKAQSLVSKLHDQMLASWYKGFTVEELESVVVVMQSAINSRNERWQRD